MELTSRIDKHQQELWVSGSEGQSAGSLWEDFLVHSYTSEVCLLVFVSASVSLFG